MSALRRQPPASKRYQALRVIGDSMAPTFRPMDQVIVDTCDTQPTPPGVFLISEGLGPVMKRVQVIPHSQPLRVKVSTDNEAYEAYEVELSRLEILGRVIAKWQAV